MYLIGSIFISMLSCPDSPNCVSSQSTKKSQYVEPFPVLTSPENDLHKIAEIIESLPRTEITSQTPTSLHAIFRSKVFKFQDHIDFVYNPEKNQIEVRSAAQTGYYDFGVNRKRVNTLRSKYEKDKQ